MEAVGIIRRVDDLGRVVIPKELGQRVGIGPDDYVELCTEEGRLVVKKYNNEESVLHLLDAIERTLKDYSNSFKSGSTDGLLAQVKDMREKVLEAQEVQVTSKFNGKKG